MSYIVEKNKMYIVEIIDPEKAELEYCTEVFNSQEEAEDFVQEVCEDRSELEGVIVSILLEKALFDNRMILTSADIVYHT